MVLLSGCSSDESEPANPPTASPHAQPPGMVFVPGGSYQMGGDAGEMGGNSHSHRTSYPIHEAYVDGFWMDQTEVTNRAFAEFVKATGYKTFAERPLPERDAEALRAAAKFSLIQLERDLAFCGPDEKPEILAKIDRIKRTSEMTQRAGAIIFSPPEGALYSETDINQWWRLEPEANWRTPDGPGSSWRHRLDHPVVNVTYEDAAAYAQWAGKRLPTEAEWERAARGGLERQPYAWGSDMFPNGEKTWMANIWQGEWPKKNTAEDGYETTAPVKTYPPNDYGLYDMAGNVWEIVADYYHPQAYAMASATQPNPTGPGYRVIGAPGQRVSHRVARGGSFLCSDAWCKGYQPGSRQPFDSESPSNHTGFRCVKDAKP